MASITIELLEKEWETYNSLKNFLRDKEKSFGEEINDKYNFKDHHLLELSDYDAYSHVKNNHTIEIKDMK